MDAKERIARALDTLAESPQWNDTTLGAAIGVTAQSVRNYRTRKSEPSVSVYLRMRENIAGFSELVDAKAAA